MLILHNGYQKASFCVCLKTVAGSGKAVNALCPPAAQSPSLDRRHESILIPEEKHLKICSKPQKMIPVGPFLLESTFLYT